MPKVEVSVEVLMEIAGHVNRGQMKSLVIKRYKTGKNVGKLFAEYSLKEGMPLPGNDTVVKRQQVASLIRSAAKAIADGTFVTLQLTKTSPDKEIYVHRLETRSSGK